MCLQLGSNVHIIRGKGPDRRTAMSSVCRRAALESRSRLAPATTPIMASQAQMFPDSSHSEQSEASASPCAPPAPGSVAHTPSQPVAALGPGLPANPLSQPH